MANTQTILIVDDDDFVRKLYVEKFKEAGFIVLEGHDGKEAYDTVKKNKVDIIFTGIIMPNMGGFELMEKLKADDATRAIPVVISSHRGKEEDRKKAFTLGARDFVVSGFVSPNEVVERGKKELGRRKAYTLGIDADGAGVEDLKKDHPELFLEGRIPNVHLIPKDGGTFDAELK